MSADERPDIAVILTMLAALTVAPGTHEAPGEDRTVYIRVAPLGRQGRGSAEAC